MGRKKKNYSAELRAVKEMGPGDSLRLKTAYPWGLAHRIYRELRDWMLEDYYHLRILYKEGVVLVMRENTNYNFVYEDSLVREYHQSTKGVKY